QVRRQPGFADPRLEPLHRLGVLAETILVNEDIHGRERLVLLTAPAHHVLHVFQFDRTGPAFEAVIGRRVNEPPAEDGDTHAHGTWIDDCGALRRLFL